MVIEKIARLLDRCSGGDRNFLPTHLYNEGWMLCLVLDWLSAKRNIAHDLSFSDNDKWYSEALLPSQFCSKIRGDKLAESWTHADGAIGNFEIGADSKGGLSLTKGASRILIVEAKMFSKLSPDVKNASYFNQAARNVACIAEVICRSKIRPSEFADIGFFVIAPESQIKEGVFAEHLTPKSIRSIVNKRVSEYKDPEKDSWRDEWFLPTMDKIRIRAISWEKVVSLIKQSDPKYGDHMNAFYEKCLEFNQRPLHKSTQRHD